MAAFFSFALGIGRKDGKDFLIPLLFGTASIIYDRYADVTCHL